MEHLEILGARVHNLKNIDLVIPRKKLVVITGLSGSGKSSLAFDTIYAEGQRRYIETFSAYARQFLGNLEKPDVDQIQGLSPVISIEQKTISRNPRSTVGTVTEIYDFLRLLFARAGEAISYESGEKMVRYTHDQILNLVTELYNGKEILLLAPVVKGRKGHYRELFEQIRKQGYLRVMVDGELCDLKPRMSVDRYKTHDIEMVMDQLTVSGKSKSRTKEAIQAAFRHGKGTMMVYETATGKSRHFSHHLMCPTTGISYDEPAPNSFSFNSPYGACNHCNGLGVIYELDPAKVIGPGHLSILKGGILPLREKKHDWLLRQLTAIGKKYDFTLDTPISKIPEEAMNIILHGSEETFQVADSGTTGRRYQMYFDGIASFIKNQYEDASTEALKKWAQSFMSKFPCPQCEGTRLKKESRYFFVDGKNIADLARLPVSDLHKWSQDVENRLTGKQLTIAKEVLVEIRKRLGYLTDLGLNYLSLDRSARSLSGGEAQRIRLASQIGAQLTGVLYILDEPSIGLHQRDNEKLIESLKELRDIGNSVLVVEHDKDMILAADHVVDIGPHAGEHGGKIVGEGPPDAFIKSHTLTADYLRGNKQIPIPAIRREGNGNKLKLLGATGNNLKDANLEIPLGTLCCVTGVSGSGKSSLINQTLYPALHRHFYRVHADTLPFKALEGLEFVDKVIDVDQAPIGRTPRSNPATYTGVFTDIRNLFASLPEARIRGYKVGRFSFNVKGGRCEQCMGAGVSTIEMNLLPDVYVLCDKCQGKRYMKETLEVRYKGKNISDVLEMTIEHALEFFSNIPSITQKIAALQEVGLGYVKLGQPSTTLSGGEAQRIKLAAELSRKDTGNTIYLLDEPTTGLHFEDIRILLEALNKLVGKGNTVVVIEHNMDVIKTADYVIDLGPEGGHEGGEILFMGTPEKLANHDRSLTAGFLAKELNAYLVR
ncbi:MAG: excinuclease ABC subunit UvrA [Flavobacteriales bacterium]|nr:excinuclease ABC subunit UvrA [Flavobacteriales bacterium]MCB9448854.1 excinuclease ABC subunit UvrA [Flavobacteriales bacterium]